jgi:hypothetical protein
MHSSGQNGSNGGQCNQVWPGDIYQVRKFHNSFFMVHVLPYKNEAFVNGILMKKITFWNKKDIEKIMFIQQVNNR